MFRTAAELDGEEPYGKGAYLVRGLTAEGARAILSEALLADPTSFMAALA